MLKSIAGIVFLAVFLSCNKPAGHDLPDYKMSKIYYGFLAPLREYTVTYSGANITELNGVGERFMFSYDASGNVVKKERFNSVTNALLKKETLEYNSAGQIVNHKIYSYDTDPNGELTFNREYLYANSKLSGSVIFSKGSSQTVNYKEIITWENENLFTVAGYDENNQRLGCTTDTRFVFDSKENLFNKVFPKFRFQELSFGINASYVFLAKNTLNKIEYPCQQPGSLPVNFTYSYDSKGMITEVFQDGHTLWKFEYK
jgi:hypothetical protein